MQTGVRFPDSSVGKESACKAGDRRKDRLPTPICLGFPFGSAGKESACNAGGLGLIPGLGRSPGEGKATHSSILPGEFPGLYSPWGRKVHGDTTE